MLADEAVEVDRYAQDSVMEAQLRKLKMGIALAAWGVVFVAATYRSHTAVVFGRYSWGYVGLLGVLIGMAMMLSLAKPVWYRHIYKARGGLIISLVSFLLSIGALELAIRMVDPLGISYYELAGDYTRDKLADERLVFRHKPSWATRYGDVRVTYNERGLRDRPVLPKAAGEYRVLALGDSVTFGWGVDQDKTFSARLEALLEERLHRPVRVINSGVGGYNTVQEMTYFKQEGITLQPDLVMLTYVQNDIEVNKGPFDPWAQSSLWGKPFPDMVLTMVGKLWFYRLMHHAYNYALPTLQPTPAATSPQEGMGWRQSMAALRELTLICEERHIPLIMFFHRLDSAENQQLFEDVVQHAQGVPVRDMGQWYGGIKVSSLVNSKVDGHPNAEGHRVMAEHMADDIFTLLVPNGRADVAL